MNTNAERKNLDHLRAYAAADNAKTADFWRSLRVPLPDSRCALCWAAVEHSFNAHREQLGVPAAAQAVRS